MNDSLGKIIAFIIVSIILVSFVYSLFTDFWGTMAGGSYNRYYDIFLEP